MTLRGSTWCFSSTLWICKSDSIMLSYPSESWWWFLTHTEIPLLVKRKILSDFVHWPWLSIAHVINSMEEMTLL